MSTGLYTLRKTYVDGDVLSASDYVADHQQHIDNQNPQETGAYSDNVTQMRVVTNPGGVGSESLASSLAGEIERLRYAVKDIKSQLFTPSQWYQPCSTLTPNACFIQKQADQVLTTVEASVTWDTDLYDPSAMHDVGSNTNRVTFAATGLYLILVKFCFTSAGTITARLVDQSGTLLGGDQTDIDTAPGFLTIQHFGAFTAGQWIEVKAKVGALIATLAGAASVGIYPTTLVCTRVIG